MKLKKIKSEDAWLHIYSKMVTGYYFENEEEEEILYVPYGFTLVRNGQDYDELNYFCLNCSPNHLEEMVLGIRTNNDFRKRILEGDVQTIEIDDKDIEEFRRIYDSRKKDFSVFILLNEGEKYKAEEIFSYIDLITELEDSR